MESPAFTLLAGTLDLEVFWAVVFVLKTQKIRKIEKMKVCLIYVIGCLYRSGIAKVNIIADSNKKLL